ncbi:MAG: DUF1232 domain-containing protein [Pseudomonadota bacterium]
MRDFSDLLREDIAAYDGPHLDLLRWVPVLFDLLGSLYEDTRLPRHARLLANAALAYFVLPHDLIPESGLGAYGYIDDLYLCAQVLHRLQAEPELDPLLDEHWGDERALGSVLAEILAKGRIILSDGERAELLRLTGLET